MTDARSRSRLLVQAHQVVASVLKETEFSCESAIPIQGSVDAVLRHLLRLPELPSPEISAVARGFLQQFELQEADGLDLECGYEGRMPVKFVKACSLVALAAAGIGAAMRLVPEDINAVVVGIVGAEAAVALGALAGLLVRQGTAEPDKTDELDGLDLAVLWVLKLGQYTRYEIAWRISGALGEEHVDESLRRLRQMQLIIPGRWEGTFAACDR